MPPLELVLLFFVVALLYASVGFGGGSSYLALLALFGVSFLSLRATALLCNIVVVSGGVWLFHRRGFLHWRRVSPLVVVSVPLAFLGGLLPIRELWFFLLLGGTLLVAALLMWVRPVPGGTVGLRTFPPWVNLLIGGGIGFLSGVVGIGGGIFLAPVLTLTRWGSPKAIAATASLFILLNSLAGLAGQLQHPELRLEAPFLLPLLGAVFLGGQVGSRLGAGPLSHQALKRATALLIAFVALRILWKYLPSAL